MERKISLRQDISGGLGKVVHLIPRYEIVSTIRTGEVKVLNFLVRFWSVSPATRV